MEETRVDAALTAPLSVEDQAMFQRVWQRVMADSQTLPVGPLPLPTPELEANIPDTEGCFTCLGKGSAVYAPLLREGIARLQAGQHSYLTLSRRFQGNTGRLLRTLAGEEQQSIRQLGASLFLLTGEWMSTKNQNLCLNVSGPAALRGLFLAEQERMAFFRRGGAEIKDPCLKALFCQLAERSQFHQDAIRRLLEGMQP